MQLKQLLDDDRAVSPVIGVILMVAITVILAAVIGTFVLGLGDQVSQTTPNASFGFDYDRVNGGNDSLTISHNGGDTIGSTEVSVAVSGGSISASNGTDSDLNQAHNWTDFGSGGDISAGSTADINRANLEVLSEFDTVSEVDLSGATVRVVWQSSGGDSSAQLGRWDGPDA